MDEIEDETTNLREQIFHNNVREQIIFLLLFILLYLSSFALLGRFKRRGREDYYSTDDDEVMVHRISTWLCTFSLAVSIGAVLLLPFSIVSNEVLILYPKSYYVKWLNSSLIQGLWNYVFLFSNLSLFVLLPFAYLFTESEGFFGHRKGLMARVQETFIVLALLAMAVLGMTYVISAVIDKDRSSIQTLLNLWSYHLPFLYSCISFLGVLMLLVCTPLGFVRLFDIVGQYLIKPQFLHDLDEEYHAYALEEECLRRRLKHAQTTGKSYMSPAPMFLEQARPILQNEKYDPPSEIFRLRNGQLQSALGLRLTEVEMKRRVLDKQRQTSSLRRNVLYPVAMILLIGLTVITVFMVLQNTVELLVGIKALPLSSRQFTLGITSLSMLGPFGAFLEIVLILYLIATSWIGLYSSPPMSRIRPRIKSTPFSLVIGNCALILILSSALPLLSKILGITNFDLLGDFGSIEWLGNFQIVFMYNLVFATAATLCIANNFTAKVRRELYARRDDEMESAWLMRNMSSMFLLADEINAFARRHLKVILAIDGPVCFNANILIDTCTAIRIQNIVAVTSDIGLGPLQCAAEHANIPLEELSAPPVWGFVGINHFVDLNSVIIRSDIYRPYQRMIKNKGGSTLPLGIIQPELRYMAYLIEDVENIWLKSANIRNFIKEKLNRPPAFAKLRALVSLLKLWYAREPSDDIISLGICSNGAHGIPSGIVFSQPAILEKRLWVPFKNFPLTEKSRQEVAQLVPPILEITEKMNIGSYTYDTTAYSDSYDYNKM